MRHVARERQDRPMWRAVFCFLILAGDLLDFDGEHTDHLNVTEVGSQKHVRRDVPPSDCEMHPERVPHFRLLPHRSKMDTKFQ